MMFDDSLPGRHNLDTPLFWCLLFDVQTSSPYDLWPASKTLHYSDAVELASFSYCSAIIAWSIESGKKWSQWGRGWRKSIRFSPTMTLYCTIILGFCFKKRQTCHRLLETDVTSFKMVDGGGNGPCPFYGRQRQKTSLCCSDWFNHIL